MMTTTTTKIAIEQNAGDHNGGDGVALTRPVAAVPQPSSLALLGLGSICCFDGGPPRHG